jgi:hypothetical protein
MTDLVRALELGGLRRGRRRLPDAG